MTGLSSSDWVNHVLTPCQNLTVDSTSNNVLLASDWSPCPLAQGDRVSVWLRADVPDAQDGNHYRVQWTGHLYAGTKDMPASQVIAGVRIDYIATKDLDAPKLYVRTLNSAPAMIVREIALMRSDNMTDAFAVASFAEWYGLT